MGTTPSFSAIFSKGGNFRDLLCLTGGRSLSKMGSTPKGKNLLRWEQIISYGRKYVHEVLVNPLGGLSLPRKSVVRLTDRPDMILSCLPWT